MKTSSLKKIVSSTVVAGVVTLGAQIVDVTPDSWNAYADDHTKTEEMKCGAGGCSAEVQAAKAKTKDKKCGVEKKCSADKKCSSDMKCGVEHKCASKDAKKKK